MNHVTMMTASVGSNQHARAAWGWEKSGKAWSSSCLNTSTSCTKLRLCSFSEFFYRFVGWFLHSSFWTHVWSWQETVPTHCEQEMQMLPGCSISQRTDSFKKCCGTDSACESWSTSYRRRESSSAWVETWFSCKVEKRTPEHGWAAITFQAAALPCSGHAAFSLIEIPFGHREFCYSCHVVDALEGMWSSKLHGNWLDL